MNRRRTRRRCCATTEGRFAAWCFYGLRHVLLHTTWYRETFFRRHAIRLAHVRSRRLQLPLPRSGRGRDEAVVLHRIQSPSAAASERPGGVVTPRSPKNSCSLKKTVTSSIGLCATQPQLGLRIGQIIAWASLRRQDARPTHQHHQHVCRNKRRVLKACQLYSCEDGVARLGFTP